MTVEEFITRYGRDRLTDSLDPHSDIEVTVESLSDDQRPVALLLGYDPMTQGKLTDSPFGSNGYIGDYQFWGSRAMNLTNAQTIGSNITPAAQRVMAVIGMSGTATYQLNFMFGNPYGDFMARFVGAYEEFGYDEG